MPTLYGLTPRSAADLRRLLQGGGRVGGRPTPATVARGTTWVTVTGPAVSGWHPAVVSLDDRGTWTDLAAVVHVASADGTDLTTGQRYPCTRTGDAADGTARFRTAAAIPAASGRAGLASDYTLSSTSTWLDTGLSIALPGAGMYLLWAQALTSLTLTAAGDDTPSASRTELKVALRVGSAFVSGQAAGAVAVDPAVHDWRTAHVWTPYSATGADTITLSAWVNTAYDAASGQTITGAVVRAAGTDRLTEIGYVRLG